MNILGHGLGKCVHRQDDLDTAETCGQRLYVKVRNSTAPGLVSLCRIIFGLEPRPG